MAMQGGIHEFNVYKMNKDERKGKKLRILLIEGKPILQLRSVTRPHSIEVDISSASKVFLPITKEYPFCFEVITKCPQSCPRLYCGTKEVFDRCVASINGELTRHIQNRGSMDSVFDGWEDNTLQVQHRGSMYSTNTLSSSKHEIYEPSDYVTMNSPKKNPRSYLRNDDQRSSSVGSREAYRKLSESQASGSKLAMKADYAKSSSDMLSKSHQSGDFKLPKNILFTGMLKLEIPNENKVNAIKLKKEIQCLEGVELSITKEDFYEIDVEEAFDELWVFRIKTDVDLCKKIHNGDKILTLNNIKVNRKIDFIERCKREEINLRIQRLPRALVLDIENDVLKTSYKGVTFTNNTFEFNKNQQDPYIITEIDSMTISEPNDILKSVASREPFRTVILHHSSFINKLKSKRKLSIPIIKF